MALFLSDSTPAIANWLPPLLMVTGVIVLGVIAALMIRNGRPPADPASTEAAKVLQQVSETRGAIEDVKQRVGELIGTAQRLSVKLDERAARLEKLLNDADQRLDAAPMVLSRRSAPQSAHAIAPGAVAESKPTSPIAATRQASRLNDMDPVKQAIYELADVGRAPLDIARELNEHVGKVELILALRQM